MEKLVGKGLEIARSGHLRLLFFFYLDFVKKELENCQGFEMRNKLIFDQRFQNEQGDFRVGS